jgi:outer membrane biosynthesis protein TonB
LTEAQRAEFERLFPSENASAAAHEAVTRAAEIAAPSESRPIAERFAGYAVSAFDAPREETARENFAIAESPAAPPAPAVESEAAIERQTSEAPPVADAIPPAATPRTTTQSLWDAPPPMMESAPGVARSTPEDAPTSRAAFAGAVPQTPMQSLWDTPPPMMRPIIGGSYDRSFGSGYGATAAEPLEDGRSKSTWSVAAAAVLVVAACFLLGFLMGPDGLRTWPKVDAARGVVVAELGHLKNAVTGSGNAAGPNTVTAPAASSTPAPSGQNAPASASTIPTVPTAPAVAPPLDAAASAARAPSAPDTTAPAAEHSGTDENAPSTSASTADSGHGRDNADTTSPTVLTPQRTESAPAATSNKIDSERREAEAARAAREAEIEKERAAAAEAYAEERAAASAARVAARPTPSAPAAETAKPAVSNPSRAEAPKPAATPPAETVPHPASPSAPPESYFPVVAPGAGNVPRLIELPEERIIDTAAVVIHSHQYVFVPAEPGPESSHALEKLQIGERITKIAPLYPAEAAQKAMGGTVHLRATIGKDGHVEDVRPINGPLMLITAAVDSILQWRYQPTLLAGQPIEMQEDFTVEFRPLGLH